MVSNFNDRGEIFNLFSSKANKDDREPVKKKVFSKKYLGCYSVVRDIYRNSLLKSYLLMAYTQLLGIRKNMNNILMSRSDKNMLRKRAVIETANDELKNICQIEYSIHHSCINLTINILPELAAYGFFPKKTAIKYQTIKTNQLTLFNYRTEVSAKNKENTLSLLIDWIQLLIY